MSASITTSMRMALRKRCAAPAWSLLEEVGDSTGHAVSRFADAIGMSLWPSRGLELHGFELKASRADWLRELNAPEKAEAISRFCDRWWVVAGAENVVAHGELPPSWGLLVLRGRVLATVHEAPKQESPAPIERRFLAALLRRATQTFESMVPKDELEARVRAGVEATVARREYDADRVALEQRAAMLDNLEGKLGISVHSITDVDEIVRAYKLTRAERGVAWKLSQIERAASLAGEVSRDLRAAMKQLDELTKEVA